MVNGGRGPLLDERQVGRCRIVSVLPALRSYKYPAFNLWWRPDGRRTETGGGAALRAGGTPSDATDDSSQFFWDLELRAISNI